MKEKGKIKQLVEEIEKTSWIGVKELEAMEAAHSRLEKNWARGPKSLSTRNNEKRMVCYGGLAPYRGERSFI